MQKFMSNLFYGIINGISMKKFFQTPVNKKLFGIINSNIFSALTKKIDALIIISDR